MYRYRSCASWCDTLPPDAEKKNTYTLLGRLRVKIFFSAMVAITTSLSLLSHRENTGTSTQKNSGRVHVTAAQRPRASAAAAAQRPRATPADGSATTAAGHRLGHSAPSLHRGNGCNMIYLLPHIYFHLHLQKNNCRFSKDSPADSIITGTQSYSLIILTAIKTRQEREKGGKGEKDKERVL